MRNQRGDVTILFALLAFGLLYAATLLEFNRGGGSAGQGAALNATGLAFVDVMLVSSSGGLLTTATGPATIVVSIRNDGGSHEGLVLAFVHSPRTSVSNDKLERESKGSNGTVSERFFLPDIYPAEREVTFAPFSVNRTAEPALASRTEDLAVELLGEDGAVIDSRTLEI
jgi:hypothetical protein